jgi:predicted Zn-dependent peptidase
MTYNKTTLPNGLRIITIPTKGNPAATVLVMAEVGSNYETKSENGLSHFLEHMCFKGTEKRPNSLLINKELDGLGAQSNAFTSAEYTGYYAKAEKRHWKQALDIVSDIYLHPTFPEADLEKERGVIIQEINMYEDLPQRKVAELFPKLLYGDTPAGRFIAGPKENIERLPREKFIEYKNKHYVASGTIVVIAGDIKETDIKKEVERLFKDIPTTKKFTKERVKESQDKPALLIEQKKTDQAHMVLGVRAYGAKDKRMPALSLLSGVLGGGMSSRLWHKLREELGVCYYVRTNTDDYTDHGYFAVSTGVDTKRIQEVIRVVLEECKRLTQELVSEEELQKTKDYLVGNFYLGLEATDALAFFYSSQEISQHTIKKPEEVERELRAVTSKDVMKVAKDIFKNEKLNLAIVGDIQDKAKIKKILSF